MRLDKDFQDRFIVPNQILNKSFAFIAATIYRNNISFQNGMEGSFSLVLFWLLAPCFAASTVCNGDFQAYVPAIVSSTHIYSYFESNTSCWYTSGGGTFEVKKRLTGSVSQTVDLVGSLSYYILCQNIKMVSQQFYNISYSMYLDQTFVSGAIDMLINGTKVTTVTSSQKNSISQKFVLIQATALTYQICFDGSAVASGFVLGKGPELDNVTVNSVTAQNMGGLNYMRFQNNAWKVLTYTYVPPTPPSNQTNNTQTNSTTTNSTVDNSTQNNNSTTQNNSTSNNSTESNSTTRNNSTNESNTTTQDNSTMPDNNTTTNNNSVTNNSTTSNNQSTTDNSTEGTDSTNSTVNQNTTNQTTNYTVKPIWQNLTVTLQLHKTVDDLKGTVLLRGYYVQHDRLTANEAEALTFLCRYYIRISIEGQEQKKFQISGSGFNFEALIYPERDYSYDKLEVYIPEKVVSQNSNIFTYFFIDIYIDNQLISFSMLDETELKVMNAFNPMAELISEAVQKGHLILSASFSSYFIVSLLSFWNLSFIYNFLNLSAAPAFLVNFLERLNMILFKVDNFTNWIIKVLKLKADTFDFHAKAIMEKMDARRNQRAWFGTMGFSSVILVNNIEAFILVGMLTVRIGLIFLVLKVLPESCKKFLSLTKPNLTKVALIEISALIPFFVLSATSAIVSMSSRNKQQKINACWQLLLMFVSISVVALNFSLIKKRRKSAFTAGMNLLLEQVLYFSIPFLILFNRPVLFLSINSSIIAFRCYYFFSRIRHVKSKLQKLHGVCINLVWIIFNFIYVFFFSYSLVQNQRKLNQKEVQMMQKCGLIAVFCILLGGVIEILKFVFQLLEGLWTLLKKIGARCIKTKNVAPEDNESKISTVVTEIEQDVIVNVKFSKKATARFKRSLKNSRNQNRSKPIYIQKKQRQQPALICNDIKMFEKSRQKSVNLLKQGYSYTTKNKEANQKGKKCKKIKREP